MIDPMRLELGNHHAKQGRPLDIPADASAVDLRALAADHGIDTAGTKAELIARLDAVTVYEPLDGPRVTVVDFPDGTSIAEAFATITSARGVWAAHAQHPPAWVACESPGLEALLAEHYACPQGAPDDVEDTHHTMSGPPGTGPTPEDDQ